MDDRHSLECTDERGLMTAIRWHSWMNAG